MANKHGTLTSLFSDIASSIRKVTEADDSKKIVADDFPEQILLLGNSVATQWNQNYDKVLSPNVKEKTISVIPKAMCYYDGYWLGVGSDSNNNTHYRIYGTTTGDLTIAQFAANRAYSFTGIECDGTNVFVCCESKSSSYKGRTILMFSLADFKSNGNINYTYFTPSITTEYGFDDICKKGEDSAEYAPAVYVAGGANGKGLIERFLSSTSAGQYWIYNAIPGAFISCCQYRIEAGGITIDNSYFLTNNGHLGFLRNPDTMEFYGFTFDYLQGATMVRHLNNYIVVACKKTDGTYLYFFTKELNLVTGFKITSDDFSVIGMAYVNGLYTVIGTTNLHKTKVWQTTNIFDHGIFGQTIEVNSIAKALATGNNNICLLSNNVQGTVVKKSLITLT